MLRQSHHGLSLFLLLAMFLQALLPLGYMPSFDENGKRTIVICSGAVTKTVTIDVTPSSEDTEENEHDNDICPFSPVNTVSNGFDHPPFIYMVDASDIDTIYTNDVNLPDFISALYASRAPPALS